MTVWRLVWHHLPAQTDPAHDLLRLGAFGLLATLVTTLWVLYNIGVYRRKGARRSVPRATWDYSRDVAGRPVDGDLFALRAAQVVTIDLDATTGQERKRYLATPERP